MSVFGFNVEIRLDFAISLFFLSLSHSVAFTSNVNTKPNGVGISSIVSFCFFHVFFHLIFSVCSVSVWCGFYFGSSGPFALARYTT